MHWIERKCRRYSNSHASRLHQRLYLQARRLPSRLKLVRNKGVIRPRQNLDKDEHEIGVMHRLVQSDKRTILWLILFRRNRIMATLVIQHTQHIRHILLCTLCIRPIPASHTRAVRSDLVHQERTRTKICDRWQHQCIHQHPQPIIRRASVTCLCPKPLTMGTQIPT